MAKTISACATPETPHRLYRVRPAHYVQHDGLGPLPAEVLAYARTHGGEHPAYIPLPSRATEFYLGGTRRVRWNGRDALPTEVMEYIAENGTLPRSTADVHAAE